MFYLTRDGMAVLRVRSASATRALAFYRDLMPSYTWALAPIDGATLPVAA